RINSKLVLPQPDGPYYDDYPNDEGGGHGNASAHYDEHPHVSSSRGWNDERHHRGASGGSGAAYDADVYYGDEGGG
ncbi:unnamed protein product, partial [Ascophyllum nodosum]